VLVKAAIGNVYTEADALFCNQLSWRVVGVREMNTDTDKYCGMSIGTANYLDLPDTGSFKRLALVIFPTTLGDAFGLYDLHLCYRNALDRAAEEDFSTVAFMDPSKLNGIVKETAARTAICTILHWLTTSPYREKINSVTIACSDAAAHRANVSIRDQVMGGGHDDPLEAHPDLRNVLGADRDAALVLFKMFHEFDISLLEKVLQAEVFNYWQSTEHGSPEMHGYETERVIKSMAASPADFFKYVNRVLDTVKGMTDPMIKRNADVLYDQIFLTERGSIELQLSKMFHLQVIPIEEPDGRIRQYVFFYSSKRDGTHSFLCYKCKMLQETTGYKCRPVVKLKADGSIEIGNMEHHPYCIPLTKAEVIFQQVNRARNVLPAVPIAQITEENEEDEESQV